MKLAADWHVAKAPVWRGDQNTHRSMMCRSWLALHGYLSDTEAARVKARIEKDRQQAGVRPIVTPSNAGRAGSVHRAQPPQGAAAQGVREIHGEGQG